MQQIQESVRSVWHNPEHQHEVSVKEKKIRITKTTHRLGKFGSQRYDRPNSTLTRGCWSPDVEKPLGVEPLVRLAARQVSKSSRSILLREILGIQNVRIFKQMGAPISRTTLSILPISEPEPKMFFWVQKKKQRVSPLRISEHQSWRNLIDSWYFKGRPSFLQSHHETIKVTRETSGVKFHQIQKNTEKHLKGTT